MKKKINFNGKIKYLNRMTMGLLKGLIIIVFSSFVLFSCEKDDQTTVTPTITPTGKMYWTAGDHLINKANPKVSATVETLYSQNGISGIAIDSSSGKIYWVNNSYLYIRKANMDASSEQDLVSGADAGSPLGLALDISGGKIYWTDQGAAIRWANMDGSSPEAIVTTGLHYPVGITVDSSGGKIYWTDQNGSNGTVNRANLDGTTPEVLINGLMPNCIALNVQAGKLYWTDQDGTINRANLDGTLPEVLVSGLNNPYGIALDISGGKMYWVDNGALSIGRANLDGTASETLVTSLDYIPYYIALDF